MTRERETLEEQVIKVLRARGVTRPRDLLHAGLPTAPLTSLVRQGLVVRAGRGLYRLADANLTEHHSLVEAAAAVPRGIVCLLSALRFHDLGTQNPHEVWLAIHPKDHLPRLDHPPIHVVRFSGEAMALGVEDHVAEGVTVKVFSAAKTVVDCFRYRNKLGLDLALEALRDYLGRNGSPDDLWKLAQACRMGRVMQPYIEASL